MSALKVFLLAMAGLAIFAIAVGLIMRLLSGSRPRGSEVDTKVLYIDDNAKQHMGYVTVTDTEVRFQGLKDKGGNLVIPLAQISEVKMSSVHYAFFANWLHYLDIILQPGNQLSKDRFEFMFQRGAGAYCTEVKTEIEKKSFKK
jgi:hypothetical protein